MKGTAKRIFLTAALVMVTVVGISVSTFALSGSEGEEVQQTYVAMGDSVAAGSGLDGHSGACDRSPLAYPNVVASSLDMSVNNLACSGAKADEGIYGEQVRKGVTIPEQMDRAFADGTPNLITLTIGANDIRWVQFIGQCYYYRCGYAIDTARSATYLADFRGELNWIMARIYNESNGNPPLVLVNGYYDPLVDTDCVAGDRVTSAELAWLHERTSKLNDAIRQTVLHYSYAHFVPVDFTGHGICSASPWIQNTDDLSPFHPNAAGAQAIARANVAAYGQAVASDTSGPNSWREEALGWFGRLRERLNTEN